MTDTDVPLSQDVSAKEKLAMSRTGLLAAMGFEEVKSASDDLQTLRPIPGAKRATFAGLVADKVGDSAPGRWWRRQAIGGMVARAQPALARYARQHPGTLVACGAGTGALLWVVKPWKLLSLAAVVALVAQRTEVQAAVARVLPRGRAL